MPEKQTLERAAEDKAEGKSPGTQAGEFVREEIEHVRKGKHGARSAKQAIAIGLSKATAGGCEIACTRERQSVEGNSQASGPRPSQRKESRQEEVGPAVAGDVEEAER